MPKQARSFPVTEAMISLVEAAITVGHIMKLPSIDRLVGKSIASFLQQCQPQSPGKLLPYAIIQGMVNHPVLGRLLSI